MTDPGYVAAGWSIAAVVLGGYTFRLARRLKRAEASADEGPRA